MATTMANVKRVINTKNEGIDGAGAWMTLAEALTIIPERWKGLVSEAFDHRLDEEVQAVALREGRRLELSIVVPYFFRPERWVSYLGADGSYLDIRAWELSNGERGMTATVTLFEEAE